MSENVKDPLTGANNDPEPEKKGKSKILFFLTALGFLFAAWLLVGVGSAFYKEVVSAFIEGAREPEKTTVAKIKEIPLGETRGSVEEKLGPGIVGIGIETENGFLDCNVYEIESGKPWRLCFADDRLKSKRETSRNDLP